MTKDEESRRADARANRDRILVVARVALAADPTAALSSIAKTAGVGQGTLYRHFPTREALLIGVYRKEVDALVAMAPTLLAKHPPLRALRLWCDRFVQSGEVKHGLADTLRAAISGRDLLETYGPVLAVVSSLLHACEAAGDIRPGVHPEDVLALLSPLLRIAPTPDGKSQVKRMLDLLFRGLAS